jgi:hypothetical protein
MAIRKLVLALSLMGLASATVVGAEGEFEMDFMQSVEDVTKNLVSNLAQENAPAVLADARELDGMLSQVEAHYTKKGDTPDAVEISKDSRVLVAEIGKLAGARDFDNATAKSSELSRACKSCHKIYKKS